MVRHDSNEEINFGFSSRDRFKLRNEQRASEKIQVIGSWEESNLDNFDRKVFCPNCRCRMDVHEERHDRFWMCGECSTILDPKIDKPLGSSGTEIVSLHDPFYARTPDDDNAPFLQTIEFDNNSDEEEEVGVKPSSERIQRLRVKGTQVPASLFQRDDEESVY